jgi:glutamine amidotransferase-like uncharacterized protein
MRKLIGVAFLLALAPFAVAEEKLIRLGLYSGKGTSESRKEVLKVLESTPNVKVQSMSVEEIQEGKLKDIDVLLMPGGTGGGQGKALEEKGREEVRNFVKGGGHYLGICAGAYLATTDYEWSLGILNAKVIDKKHWARGHGPVKLAITDEGKNKLNTKDKETEIIYWQGPLLAPGDSKDVPAFETLAKFETEIAENGASPGVMKGTVAIAAGTFGKGKVICFSPHPEKQDSTNDLLRSGLKWLTEKK